MAVSGYRAWGLASTLRFLGRRAVRRFWSSLHDPDFWRDSYWRRGYWLRRGAKLDWPIAVTLDVKVVGPAELFEVGVHSGLGEQTIYLTQDSRLLPYFGLWHRARVRIDDHVLVGTGSVVLPGVTVGPRAAVGAFSLVNRDTGEDVVAMGRPHRVVGSLRRFYLRRLADIQRRPHLYPEAFEGFALSPIPWPDLSQPGEPWLRTDFSPDPLTRLRNLVRDALLWVRDRLDDQDELRRSEQRIDWLRRRGYRIGAHCYVDRRVVFDRHASLIEIGDHCAIGAYAAIQTQDRLSQGYTGRARRQPVRIRDGSVIGAAALIGPGVTIGPASVVEPAAVVTRDVPPCTVVSGAPARPVASLAEWLAERRREIEAHPEQYVPEPRLRTYPLSAALR